MIPAKGASKHKEGHAEKDPNFMVQVSEPRMLRKDLLESVREIIIFMQGYEKFRKIQEDKVTLFTQLKTDLRVLNSLVDDKLRKYLPKGKLRAVQTPKQDIKPYARDEELLRAPSIQNDRSPASELDELESQLKNIETQLRSVN